MRQTIYVADLTALPAGLKITNHCRNANEQNKRKRNKEQGTTLIIISYIGLIIDSAAPESSSEFEYFYW